MRMPLFVTKRVLKMMKALAESRPADVNIGPEGDAYMQRWFVIPRNRVFNIYLHIFRHDDERVLHSHPWWSISLLLWGTVAEYWTPSANGAADVRQHRFAMHEMGAIAVRSASLFHRIELRSPAAMTLFITGPKIRTWFFACAKGLVRWDKYVEQRDGNVSAPGAGCGELS